MKAQVFICRLKCMLLLFNCQVQMPKTPSTLKDTELSLTLRTMDHLESLAAEAVRKTKTMRCIQAALRMLDDAATTANSKRDATSSEEQCGNDLFEESSCLQQTVGRHQALEDFHFAR